MVRYMHVALLGQNISDNCAILHVPQMSLQAYALEIGYI